MTEEEKNKKVEPEVTKEEQKAPEETPELPKDKEKKKSFFNKENKNSLELELATKKLFACQLKSKTCVVDMKMNYPKEQCMKELTWLSHCYQLLITLNEQ